MSKQLPPWKIAPRLGLGFGLALELGFGGNCPRTLLTLIKNTFGECFILHSNLDFNVSLNSFPEFYINIFLSWKNTSAFLLLAPSCLRSQFLWFNKDIKLNIKPFHFKNFSKENINFVENL